MQHRLHTVVLAGALLAVGCTPSPERLCDRKMKLAEQQWGKMDPQTHAAGRKNCLDEARKLKAANPNRYACAAACVTDSRNLLDAADCDAKCP